MPKAPDDNTGLVGVWAFGSASIVKTRTFVFCADGRYAMIDPLGDTQNNGGGPGVEYGTYSHNSTTLALRILTVTVDTNGCAGLQDSRTSELASFNLVLSADGRTASLIEGTESYSLFRITLNPTGRAQAGCGGHLAQPAGHAAHPEGAKGDGPCGAACGHRRAALRCNG